MSRQATLEPRWLVGLLNAWAKRSLAEQSRAVGWYSVCPMLRDGIPARARSYEPTGYSGTDHTDTIIAIQLLPVVQQMAIGRYFKPWAKANIEAEFHMTAEQWLKLLRAAMASLEKELRRPVADLPDCG